MKLSIDWVLHGDNDNLKEESEEHGIEEEVKKKLRIFAEDK